MQLKNKILDLVNGTDAYGIELVFDSEKEIYNCCHLKKKSNSIHIEESFSVASFTELKERINNNIPILLSFSGKGIVLKKVNPAADIPDEILIQQVLPNADLTEFYFQKSESNKKIIATVARKNVIDAVLDQLAQNNKKVISFTIGPHSIGTLLHTLKTNEQHINTESYSIVLVNNEIDSVQSTKEKNGATDASISFSGIALQQKYAIAFASAFHFLALAANDSVKSEKVSSLQKEFKHFRYFKFTLVSLLSLLLFSLLLNAVLFSSYNEKNKYLTDKVNLNKDQLILIDTLEKKLSEKKQFFEEVGWLALSRNSFYADQLALNKPSTIRFTKLSINPFRTMEEDNGLHFKLEKNIQLFGTCNKATELNEWINVLKTKKWVDKVEILNYTSEKGEQRAKFSILINYKENV